MVEVTSLDDKPVRLEECEKHGVYESVNFFGRIWSGCPDCAEAERRAEAEAAELRKREAELHRWRIRVGGTGIPERFQSKSLDDYEAANPGQARVLRFAKGYVENFDEVLRTGQSALFLGKPGTGKTHLAAGIGMQLLRDQNRRVMFTTVIRAVRRVKETWARGSEESEAEAIRSMVLPDLLILDEVGIQFGSDTERNILFDLINERYEKCRPTLILSNLSVEEVSTFLGERIMDRLRENGGKCFLFDWESRRRG